MPIDFIIRWRCDEQKCGEHNELGHVTEPKQMPLIIEHFGIKEPPPGWSCDTDDGQVYCPRHATRLVKATPLSIAALGRKH